MKDEDIKSTYLPLSGGTMTGCVYNSAGYYSFTNNAYYKELLLGGTANGGRIAIRAGDGPNANNNGSVIITSVNQSTNEEFHLVPWYDGKLWWNNNPVVCEKYYSNSETGYAYYSNGMAYVWGKKFFPAGVDRLQITFSYPLIDSYYNVFGSAYTSVCDVIAMSADLTTTGFLFCCRRSYDLKYDFDINASYFVVGRWK